MVPVESWRVDITHYYTAKTEIFFLIQIKWLIFSKIGGSWGKVQLPVMAWTQEGINEPITQ